jgi:hypothetical protein
MSNQQHSFVTYQADSALDYLWVNWLTQKEPSAPTHRWMDYPYNETHTLHHHTLTNEFIYKPIRFLTAAFNSTHQMVTDTIRNEVEYQPIPEKPTATHVFIMNTIIVLFYLGLIYLVCTADYSAPRATSRSRSVSRSPYARRSRLAYM